MEKEMKEIGISRRSFIKGMGGVAAAATVLGYSLKAAKAEGMPHSVTLPKDMMLEIYRRMQRIRQGELIVREMHTNQDPKYYYPITGLRGPAHTSAGEEATCVGVSMAMEKGDQLTGTHRSHGYPLGLGLNLRPWMAELMGKATGTQRGHGGSMHIAYPDIGILAMSGIVGSGVPHALGVARAFQLQGKKQVAVSTCGDGAMNTSGFNPSLNWAMMWNAPIVFVINNNKWAVDVKDEWYQALAKAGKDLSTRASGFAMPGITVDGNDVFAVYNASKYCIDNARAGKGPSLLECVTYRQWGHGGPADHEVTMWPYNNPDELNYWLKRDPIKRFESVVLQGLLTEGELETIRKQVAAEVQDAVEFAIKSPFPDPEEDFRYIREVFKA